MSDEHKQADAEYWAAELAKMKATIDELAKYKERMDWLEQMGRIIMYELDSEDEMGRAYICGPDMPHTLRETCDQAMAEERDNE